MTAPIQSIRAWLRRPLFGTRGLRRGAALLLLCGVAFALRVAAPLDAHLRAMALLLAVVEHPDPTGLLARFTEPVTEHELSLPLGRRSVRCRRYVPQLRAQPPGMVLLHGVHHRGIDERRFVAFARALAQAGIDVLTPALDELAQYRVVPSTITTIGDAATAHAHTLGRASVGVVGISFAGGLSLLAAASQRDEGPIGYVVTVGAHHDLLRLSQFYAGVPIQSPDGSTLPTQPHPYGARVIAHAHAEQFFEGDDVPRARAALEAYLHEHYARARTLAESLSNAGRERITIMLDNNRKAELGALLLNAVNTQRTVLGRVSPRGALATLAVPTFLVHGAGDPIIPSVETRWLANEVPRPWLRQAVISNVLRHAEINREPTPGEYWELVHFMGDVLSEADRH